MTLELNKVSRQVAHLGEQAAQRQHDLELVVPQVQKILREHAADAEEALRLAVITPVGDAAQNTQALRRVHFR